MEIKEENLEFAKQLIEKFQKIIIEKEPDLELFLRNSAKVRQSLMNESDRGCVLLAVSYLESILTDLLKANLIGNKKHLKDIFDFNGPLGSFSGKIKMSYSIGMISEEEKSDLDNIRKLRNIFAHSPSQLTLNDDSTKKIIENLRLDSRKRDNDTPRRKFISVTWYIISTLRITDNIKKFKYNRTKDPLNKIFNNKIKEITELINKPGKKL